MIAVVDSGTTRTRVRLWDGGKVVSSQSQQAGARDTASDGHPGRVKTALKEMLAGVKGLGAVLCSGMITSNVGLKEVPHLLAPCSPEKIARGIVRQEFPEIAEAPFYFIPGIKTVPEGLSLENLEGADVMRGEEAETVGLRELLGLTGPVLLMHYGSHHKAIRVDGDGTILGSKTSITGELLQAVMSGTVLRSSVVGLEDIKPSQEYWRAGLEAAQQHGLGRASFLVRIGEQLAGLPKPEMTSYLLGALASLDLPMLERGENIILYGSGHFPPLMKAYLDERGIPATLVSPEVSENAAVIGALRLFERYQGA
ncbi:MAG: 2-keto-3-deoxy-galactonokinase [Meiothermus sp.]